MRYPMQLAGGATIGLLISACTAGTPVSSRALGAFQLPDYALISGTDGWRVSCNQYEVFGAMSNLQPLLRSADGFKTHDEFCDERRPRRQ